MIIESKNNIISFTADLFDIGQTLTCGQCFRFGMLEKNTYRIIAQNRILTIYVSNPSIRLSRRQ